MEWWFSSPIGRMGCEREFLYFCPFSIDIKLTFIKMEFWGGFFKIVEGGGGGGVAGRGARDEWEDCSFRHLPIHSLEPTGGDSATNYPHLGKDSTKR